MDPQHFSIINQLMYSARSADWKTVEALAGTLSDLEVPQDRNDLARYIRALKETLVVARACRADLMLTAHRVAAAAGFQAHE